MPIRLIDASAALGQIAATLTDASSALVGTHVLPPGRTGVMGAQLQPHVGALTGQFQANANRVGTIGSTLAAAVASFSGSSSAPVGQESSIRFTPGHYKYLNTGSGGGGLSGWTSQIDAIDGEPLAGAQVILNWAAFEGNTRGDYSAGFATIDALRNACAAIGKKLMIIPAFQFFGTQTTSVSGKLPTYLSTIDGGNPGYSLWPGGTPWAGNLVLVAHLWKSAVMAPYIEMGQAYANRYKNDATVEMWGFGETSVDAPSGSGYTEANWVGRIKDWITAMRAAWPSTAVRVNANYLQSDAAMNDLIDFAYAHRCAVGGPDNSNTRSFQANRLFTNAANVAGRVDYSNRIPWVSESQYPAASSGAASVTSSQIYNHALTGDSLIGGSMQPQYFVWLNNTYTGDPPGTFHTFPGETLPFIRSINGASNTANPYVSSVIPAMIVDFNRLANNANVSATGTAGKRFGFWGTFANGYGTRATTASARPGKTSSARMTIQAGNDGGTGGGTGPNGSFGGGISASTSTWPAAVQVGQGGEIWIGLWIKPQPSPNYLTNTGSLKFLRTILRDSGGTSYGGKIETLLAMDGSGNHTGYNLMTENDPKTESDTLKTCDRLLIADSWNWFEIYFKISSVAADCVRRVWVNDDLAYERTLGEHNKWHQSGAWQEADFALSTPEALMEVSSDTLGGLFLSTYWNGNAPSDQRWDIQAILAHATAGDLTATDEFGNKMMGSGAYA